MARKTKAEAEKTRQSIMASALELIAQRGLSGTSLEHIANHAGVTRGAAYWHFRNKNDLFRAMLEDWLAPTQHLIADYLLDQPPSLEHLKGYMEAWLAHLETDDRTRKLFTIVFFKVEQVGEAGALIEELNLKATQDLQALQLYLNELRQAGEIDGETDLKLLAASISAFLMGHAQTWLARPEHYSLKDHAQTLVTQFFSGYLPRSTPDH
ncbi:hypothetical protein CK501_13930 [Halovibrio salipaludis]|uniref:HTH tetR-type domain-containing protein n=1 Tax=Halovibrio salipaludis TaxID=2032626 RepID=A0A2A2EZL7_9GAMM|nr:TetR family transcriptional regulator [Halovibrio salipaludis]PAU77792.1 hypothetical protein CK501_13930 [Halovibrio salipaludis]